MAPCISHRSLMGTGSYRGCRSAIRFCLALLYIHSPHPSEFQIGLHRLLGSIFGVFTTNNQCPPSSSPLTSQSPRPLIFVPPRALHSFSSPRSGWQVSRAKRADIHKEGTYTSDKGYTHGNDNIHKTRRRHTHRWGTHTDGTYTRMGYTHGWDIHTEDMHTERTHIWREPAHRGDMHTQTRRKHTHGEDIHARIQEKY